MHSDKCNSIMAIATGLSLHPEMCLFANRSSSIACIMILPKLTFVLLCIPFLSPLPHRWQFAVHAQWLRCETWVSAVLAGALVTLFFAWNGSQWRNQTFADARAKPGQATYPCSTHTHVHLDMGINILLKICCSSYSVCKISILAIAMINLQVYELYRLNRLFLCLNPD